MLHHLKIDSIWKKTLVFQLEWVEAGKNDLLSCKWRNAFDEYQKCFRDRIGSVYTSVEQILMHFDDDKIADPGRRIRAGDIIIQPRERGSDYRPKFATRVISWFKLLAAYSLQKHQSMNWIFKSECTSDVTWNTYDVIASQLWNSLKSCHSPINIALI